MVAEGSIYKDTAKHSNKTKKSPYGSFLGFQHTPWPYFLFWYFMSLRSQHHFFFTKRSNLMVYQTWCPMPDVICRFIIFIIFLVFLKCFTYEYMYVTMCVHAHVRSYPGRQEEGTAGLPGSCELTTQCGC